LRFQSRTFNNISFSICASLSTFFVSPYCYGGSLLSVAPPHAGIPLPCLPINPARPVNLFGYLGSDQSILASVDPSDMMDSASWPCPEIDVQHRFFGMRWSKQGPQSEDQQAIKARLFTNHRARMSREDRVRVWEKATYRPQWDGHQIAAVRREREVA